MWHPSYISKEEFEGTKGLIRVRKSEDRLCNGQRKRDKIINNDPQNTTQKAKDRTMRIPLNTGSEFGCSDRVGSSYSTDNRGVILVTNPMINHETRKDRKVLKTRGTYLWSVVPQRFSKD